MSADKSTRKLLWWNMPISPDKSAEAGWRMIRATLIWLAVVVGLALIVGAIVVIA